MKTTTTTTTTVVHWGTPLLGDPPTPRDPPPCTAGPISPTPRDPPLCPYTARSPPLHRGTHTPSYTAGPTPPKLHRGTHPPPCTAGPPPLLHCGTPPHSYTAGPTPHPTLRDPPPSLHRGILYTVVLFSSLYIAKIAFISLGRTS